MKPSSGGAADLPFEGKLAYNVGLIVLASQDLERYLKLMAAVSDSPLGGSITDRHQKLFRRPLGAVLGLFLRNLTVTEGSPEAVNAYFHSLLDRRNKVVHHFLETYGAELSAGKHAAILQSLGQLLKELRCVTKEFRGASQAVLQLLMEPEDSLD